MERRFTKKYLQWFYDIRVQKIQYNENQTAEAKLALEDLQAVKWTKRSKYTRSYIDSGGLTKSIQQVNLFNSQLEDFYSKLV